MILNDLDVDMPCPFYFCLNIPKLELEYRTRLVGVLCVFCSDVNSVLRSESMADSRFKVQKRHSTALSLSFRQVDCGTVWLTSAAWERLGSQ